MTITVLDTKTNRTFKKEFRSPYLAEQWMKKRKYSKTLRIIDISSPSVYFGR